MLALLEFLLEFLEDEQGDSGIEICLGCVTDIDLEWQV